MQGVVALLVKYRNLLITNKIRIKMKTLKTKLGYALCILLATFLFASCDGYPVHTVCEGRQNMIVYKVEKINDAKYGDYKYAVTDATGKDWTLKTFQKFQVGDTLRISNAL